MSFDFNSLATRVQNGKRKETRENRSTLILQMQQYWEMTN